MGPRLGAVGVCRRTRISTPLRGTGRLRRNHTQSISQEPYTQNAVLSATQGNWIEGSCERQRADNSAHPPLPVER